MAHKHREHPKLKKFLKKVTHPFDVIVHLAEKAGKALKLAPLLPLMPVMESALKRKNIPIHGTKLDKLDNTAHQFLKVIIFKEAPLASPVSHFEHADEEEDSEEVEVEDTDTPEEGYVAGVGYNEGNSGSDSGGPGSGGVGAAPYQPNTPNTANTATSLPASTAPITAVNQAVPPHLFPNFNGVLHGIAINPKFLQTQALAPAASARKRGGSGSRSHASKRSHGRRHFEHADGDTTDATNEGGYAKTATNVITIIKKIVAFITANKKKLHSIQTGTQPVLTPDEIEAHGNDAPDKDLAADSDVVQDHLVSKGVGDIKSSDPVQHSHQKELGWFEEFWERLTGHKPVSEQREFLILNESKDKDAYGKMTDEEIETMYDYFVNYFDKQIKPDKDKMGKVKIIGTKYGIR